MQVVHVGDIGTIFRVPFTKELDGSILNVSSASAAGQKKIIFHRPDGTEVIVNATFTTNGTDGLIEYATDGTETALGFPVDDPQYAGVWAFRGYVLTTNWEGYSKRWTFRVEEVE